MVDEVEIKNVGGRFGIASEATLSALVEKLGGRGGNTRQQQLETLARNASTRSIRNENRERSGLIEGISNNVKGVVNLGKEAMTGGNRLGDFSETVLGASSALSEMIRYAEGLTDTFRDLSSYGASFNNNLFDLRLAAAESEMAFDDFATMVRENSSVFSRLGGTVSEGAKQFGVFSRTLRTSKVGTELMGMGFTINSINEGLTYYLESQLMSGRRIEMRDRALIESSGEYLAQLDKLSKLTGKQREELARQSLQLQQDAGIRRQLNNLDVDNKKNLQNTLQFIRSTMPNLSSSFEDMMDGLSQTPIAQLLEMEIKGLKPLLERAWRGEISEVDFIEQMKQFTPQIEKLQNRYEKEILTAMHQAGGMPAELATLIDNLYEVNQLLNINTGQYDLEVDQRSRLTTLFSNFEQTVETARGRLTSAFIESPAFDALERLGTRLADLVSENGSIEGFSSGLDRIFDYFFGEQGAITRTLEWFTDFISSPTFESDMNRFFETVRDITNRLVTYFIGTRTEVVEPGTGDVHVDYVGGLFERIYNTFEDVFNGKKTILDVIYEGFESIFTTITNTIRPIIRNFLFGPQVGYGVGSIDPALAAAAGVVEDGGFIKTLTDGFWDVLETMQTQIVNFWEGPNGTKLRDTISGFFENLIEDLRNALIDAGIPFLGRSERYYSNIREQVDAGIALPEQIEELAQEIRRNQAEAHAAGIDEAVVGTLEQLNPVLGMIGRIMPLETSAYYGSRLGQDFIDWLNETTPEDIIRGNRNPEPQERPAVPTFEEDWMQYEFATGTSGFQNFGRESLAALHGVEAVVPRNTPAGDFLDRYFTDDWQAKQQPGMEPIDRRSNNSQENLVKYLIQLNSTMVSVLAEIRRTNELEKQTLNSMRGLGGDMFRSV
jgi:hypothetical protein